MANMNLTVIHRELGETNVEAGECESLGQILHDISELLGLCICELS